MNIKITPDTDNGKRKIKIERQITRTTKRSIDVLCVRATESLESKHFIKTKCKEKNKVQAYHQTCNRSLNF